MKCPHCGSENVRKAKIGNEQRESKNAWKCLNCGRIFYVKPEPEESTDQSVYSDDPEATQKDDMEEDLALLEDSDDLW